MHNPPNPWLWCSAGLLLLSGCASDRVIFVTKTSLGVDVETTPPSASLAYDRVEGYAGPQLSDGSVLPVAGSILTNGKLFDRKVKQVYATGNAALIVSRKLDEPELATSTTPEESKLIFFGTGTVVGLKLGFGAGGVTNSLSLGYKRKELSIIPFTDPKRLPSVLATLSNVAEGSGQTTAGLDQQQYFATGSAADALAARPDVRKLFGELATSALGIYRESETEQHRLVLGTLSCLSRIPDVDVARVWNNAEALDLFHGNNEVLSRIRAASSPDAARAEYTRHFAIINADDPVHTQRLALHQAAVCAYATLATP